MFLLGGPNGLLPLALQNRAVTESFGITEIPGSKHFCDLCRKLPHHGNSDHLMSFKERVSGLTISVVVLEVAASRT